MPAATWKTFGANGCFSGFRLQEVVSVSRGKKEMSPLSRNQEGFEEAHALELPLKKQCAELRGRRCSVQAGFFLSTHAPRRLFLIHGAKEETRVLSLSLQPAGGPSGRAFWHTWFRLFGAWDSSRQVLCLGHGGSSCFQRKGRVSGAAPHCRSLECRASNQAEPVFCSPSRHWRGDAVQGKASESRGSIPAHAPRHQPGEVLISQRVSQGIVRDYLQG